jgi:hypothetical protein
MGVIMARIQVLALPRQPDGALSSAPYILIIDQAKPGEFVEGIDEDMVRATGAKTVLVVEQTLDVA